MQIHELTQPKKSKLDEVDFVGPDRLSCASSLARRVLSLPLYPELTDLEVEYIIDQVIDVAQR